MLAADDMEGRFSSALAHVEPFLGLYNGESGSRVDLTFVDRVLENPDLSDNPAPMETLEELRDRRLKPLPFAEALLL